MSAIIGWVMEVTADISTIACPTTFRTADMDAWSNVECPDCRKPKMLIVAIRDVKSSHFGFDDGLKNTWLLCVACGIGAVLDKDGQLSPPSMEYPTPEGTPQTEARIWSEVRACLSIHAYSAVAMLCRKLLLHLVFTHKRSQDPQAKPPKVTFAEAVQYLANHGVITLALKPLANEIKDVGNRANHELPDISGGEARKIASFTHFLFQSVYEMPKKASIDTEFVGSAAEPYEGDLDE